MPDAWKIDRVGSVLSEMAAGVSVNSTDVPASDGQIGILKTSCVSKGGFDPKKNKAVMDGEEIVRVRQPVQAGTIIVSRMNTPELVGANGYVDADFPNLFLPDRLWSLKPKKNVDGRWLGYWFASPHTRYALSALGTGTSGSMKNITKEDVRSIPIAIPPLPEQQTIADVLSTWDEAIETTEKLLANAEAQKRALMQQLLTGKRRLKGYETREWKRCPLDAVFERVRRKNTAGNRNVLTISGKEGLVSQLKYFNKLVASADTSSYTLLRGGEFAYNKSYSAGYPLGAIKMLPIEEEGVLSSLYICFRLLNKNRDCSDFYRHWFEFGGLNLELSVVAQEGARNHGLLNVGVSEFFKLLVSRPDAEEQREIAALLNGAELQAHNVEHQLERLKLEKRALMQQLLTGKRRVTP